jgi:predicted DNA-binding transcriptional regulator YafY
MLAEDETKAVLAGLDHLSKQRGAGLSDSAKKARSKIRALLPQDARAAVSARSATTEPQRKPVSLFFLRSTLERRKRLAIGYVGRGRSIERVIWPVAIDTKDEIRVLVGWSERHKGYRSFPIEGLISVRLLDDYACEKAALMRDYRTQFADRNCVPPIPDRI